jgi:hypothetical protein
LPQARAAIGRSFDFVFRDQGQDQKIAACGSSYRWGVGKYLKKMDLCANVDGHNLNPLWIVPAGLVRFGSSAA